jgi:hypothetical protein
VTTVNMKTARPGLVLLVACLATFAINLDTNIVNVALPSLTRQIGATTWRSPPSCSAPAAWATVSAAARS